MDLKNKQLEFGPFAVDIAGQQLLRDSKAIPLPPKAFDTLLFLLSNSRRLVTREELMKAVWPDSFVEDGNVSVNIFQLRKVLGGMEDGRPFIETVPRKGYRFCAEVRTIDLLDESSTPLVLQPSDSLRPAPLEGDSGPRPPLLHTEQEAEAMPHPPRSPRGGALREIIPFPDPKGPPLPAAELWPRDAPASRDATAPRMIHPWALIAGLCLIALGALGLIGGLRLWHHSAQAPEAVTERRLTSFAPEMAVTAAAISTGAKFFAYANPGGLFVQVISTGETHPLPLPAPRFEVASISWFPDSASLLVDGAAPQDATFSLWIVPVIGASRPIDLGPYPPGVVSPDGAEIALVDNRGAAPEIELMNAQGGGVRTLVTGGQGEIFGGVSWVHGGRKLLFVRYRWDAQFRRNSGSIDEYDISSGKTEKVLTGSDLGGDAVSLPGGRIVYSTIGGANPSISGSRVLAVATDRRTGKASGSPILLASWDAPVAGFTVNNAGARLVLRDLFVQHSVYLADLGNGGRSLGSPVRLSFGVGREDYPRAWSPDSQSLFIDTNRNGNWQIYRRALESESALPFTAGADDQFAPCVSPDGAWLLYMERPRAWHEGDPARIMRVPIAGGLPQLVLTASGFADWGLRFDCPRRAGLPCIMAQRQGNQVAFRSFDPAKGLLPSGREIARLDASGSMPWAVSPDGSELAWINRGSGPVTIHVLPLAYGSYGVTAGVAHDVVVHGWSSPRSITWAPDGKGWYAVSSTGEGWTLLYINRQGKPGVLMTSSTKWAPDVYSSPDGRHLAFSMQSTSSNVWMMQGF